MDIYISNLRKGLSVEMLRQSFSHFGDVASVRIVFSEEKRQGKDFAVISLHPHMIRSMPISTTDHDRLTSVAV